MNRTVNYEITINDSSCNKFNNKMDKVVNPDPDSILISNIEGNAVESNKKISELDKIGNLNNLNTVYKTDLVTAINEVALGHGSTGGDVIPILPIQIDALFA